MLGCADREEQMTYFPSKNTQVKVAKEMEKLVKEMEKLVKEMLKAEGGKGGKGFALELLLFCWEGLLLGFLGDIFARWWFDVFFIFYR